MEAIAAARRASASRRSTAAIADKAALVAAVVAGRLPGTRRARPGEHPGRAVAGGGTRLPRRRRGVRGADRRADGRAPPPPGADRRASAAASCSPAAPSASRWSSAGRARGDIRDDVEPVTAIDLFAGPFLARVFAGADTGRTGAGRPSPAGGTSSKTRHPHDRLHPRNRTSTGPPPRSSPTSPTRTGCAPGRPNTVSAVQEGDGPLGLGTRLREVHRGPGGRSSRPSSRSPSSSPAASSRCASSRARRSICG